MWRSVGLCEEMCKVKNVVKDLVSLIVFACVAFAACCADSVDSLTFVLAGCALLLAWSLVELEWHGVFDAWDEPRERRRGHT